jgi:hypothetical protein
MYMLLAPESFFFVRVSLHAECMSIQEKMENEQLTEKCIQFTKGTDTECDLNANVLPNVIVLNSLGVLYQCSIRKNVGL